ncbi:MAG: glycoside hydrolase [Candidatus Aminicenantes bacterium RBG_16_63_16]|nr:MAG: glycoside hydrolase [Candidatus Aminicenantes bacterium RBG_16_63_16]
MSRMICIHGHFYQPPRENAWLEEIEIQDSARPYHDWNERVAAECYGPNSAARILDREGKIAEIVNNYARISFNFGPTLLSWMKDHDPEVYESILRADKESAARFSGHGGAIAQCFNHLIMPLANARDKQTQVVWGMRDFKHRFGRTPEGMWLPEAAVDSETLDVMAAQGIKFTVLAPHQAAAVRPKGGQEWRELKGSGIDPKKPYACPLPSGRTIALFFYDGPIAHDVAFGGLLKDGENFARRLLGGFAQDKSDSQLVHIATDGETYGHHSRFGDMALAYCLSRVEAAGEAQLTVYGEYLEKNPPADEVRIVEKSSWSCPHGVERWRGDCGCNTGTHAGWKQAWRAPLRKAMDGLRDALAEVFEKEMGRLVGDPWQAREDYIDVVLDRSPGNVKAFLAGRSSRKLTSEEVSTALRLLEMQRNAMLMSTSCGWFFDDISGIESVQVLQYAARAMQLAREIGGGDLEPDFLAILRQAPSNVPEYKNGKNIYKRLVKPAALDLLRVGAHYAVSSLFEKYAATAAFGAFTARGEACHLSRAGRQKVAVGRVRVRSEITWDEADISFAVLHLGDHNLLGGVRLFQGEQALESMRREIDGAFGRSDIPGVIELLDRHFGSHRCTLKHLFQDEKRKVIGQILEETLEEIRSSFHRIYEDNYPMMLALKDMGLPLPTFFSAPLGFILNKDLERLLQEGEIDVAKLTAVAREFGEWELEPDRASLGYLATRRINAQMSEASRDPAAGALKTIDSFVAALDGLDLGIDLWKCQNIFFFSLRDRLSGMKDAADKGDEPAREWLEAAGGLARRLGIKVKN